MAHPRSPSVRGVEFVIVGSFVVMLLGGGTLALGVSLQPEVWNTIGLHPYLGAPVLLAASVVSAFVFVMALSLRLSDGRPRGDRCPGVLGARIEGMRGRKAMGESGEPVRTQERFYKDALLKYQATSNALVADVIAIADIVGQALKGPLASGAPTDPRPSQGVVGALRRAYVRAVFALIEGNTFGLKQCALAAHRERDLGFTPGEVAFLSDEGYKLADNGTVYAEVPFINLTRNIRLAARCIVRATGSTHVLDVGGAGWVALQKAIKIRNRLTHPRGCGELEISNDDIDVLRAAESWYREQDLKLWRGDGEAG